RPLTDSHDAFVFIGNAALRRQNRGGVWVWGGCVGVLGFCLWLFFVVGCVWLFFVVCGLFLVWVCFVFGGGVGFVFWWWGWVCVGWCWGCWVGCGCFLGFCLGWWFVGVGFCVLFGGFVWVVVFGLGVGVVGVWVLWCFFVVRLLVFVVLVVVLVFFVLGFVFFILVFVGVGWCVCLWVVCGGCWSCCPWSEVGLVGCWWLLVFVGLCRSFVSLA
ncbi:hypothetical protein RA279_27525, partial [Pseudomonas syringae pv. tagetis]|uniref:hypothetical protein n=1 Tax=Pseudomonas syringae group genomosp. 7 TaxID=251699 RepID=UPI00376F649C